MHRLFYLRESIAPFYYSFFVGFYFLLKCRNLCLPYQEVMNYMRSWFFIQLQAHWNADCQDVANLFTRSLRQVFAPCSMHALNHFLYLRNTFPLFLIQGYFFEFVLEPLSNLSDHLVFPKNHEPLTKLVLLTFLFQSYCSLFIPSLSYEVPLVEVHNISLLFLLDGLFSSLFVDFCSILVDLIVLELSVQLCI